MNAKEHQISFGQFLIVLLICRIFTLMTFSSEYSHSIQIPAAVISIIIQAIILIPIVIFGKLYPHKDVSEVICEKNGFFGYVVTLLYLIFFIFYTINIVLCFMEFLTLRFFPEENNISMLLILMAVCIYCGYCGIEGISRSSSIVLVLFIIMLIIMAISSASNFDILNFYSYKNKNDLLGAVLEDLARNSEITAAAFLIKNVKSRIRCALYGLLAAKLTVTEIISAMIISVLGDYAQFTKYPFLSVGSYAGVGIFQRYDSLYLILWTISAVITISLFISVSASITEKIYQLKYTNLIIGTLIFLSSSIIIFNGGYFPFYDTVTVAFMIVLTGIIPLILCFMKGKQSYEKSEKEI